MFQGPYRAEKCLDAAAAEDKMIYSVTNVVKDQLIESVKSKSPFFSTYQYQANGKPMEYWYIDWGAYWKNGGHDAFIKGRACYRR